MLKAVPELSLSDVVLGQVGEYLLLVVVVMVSLLSCSSRWESLFLMVSMMSYLDRLASICSWRWWWWCRCCPAETLALYGCCDVVVWLHSWESLLFNSFLNVCIWFLLIQLNGYGFKRISSNSNFHKSSTEKGENGLSLDLFTSCNVVIGYWWKLLGIENTLHLFFLVWGRP